MWGTSAVPTVVSLETSPRKDYHSHAVENGDHHLRSIHAVRGYQIKASDGEIGHVFDFLIDERTWSIQHIVVKMFILLTGKEVWIPVDRIMHIIYRESTITVDMTRDEIAQRPTWYPLIALNKQ